MTLKQHLNKTFEVKRYVEESLDNVYEPERKLETVGTYACVFEPSPKQKLTSDGILITTKGKLLCNYNVDIHLDDFILVDSSEYLVKIISKGNRNISQVLDLV